MENKITTIIMAAGGGTRMKSKLPKVLHNICGYPIIEYIVNAACSISDYSPIVVVGHGSEQVKSYLGDRVRYAFQSEQLGTGHAVMMAGQFLENTEGYVVVLAGDIPLITAKTIKNLVDYAAAGSYSAVALSAVVDDASGYGRIIRDANGDFSRIVEHKDATDQELQVREINSSIYCFESGSLLKSLSGLNNNNAQNEYYLTDVLTILKGERKKVGVFCIHDSSEIMGINTRVQLAQADKIMRLKINNGHMNDGVTIIDPENTYIGPYVQIGRDTVVYPSNVIDGDTKIGEDCILYPGSRIVNSKISDNVNIQSSVILDSKIGSNTSVGPFAYLRPGSVVGNNVRIGDFVEIKNSNIGDYTKVSHLTYIGDGDVGQNVNVGCGVVFVNYDGKQKHRTSVGDNAFIGCNVNLVAPVEVEDDAYIAAGSTITDKVPEGSLSIARARQTNKEGWVDKKGLKRIVPKNHD